MNTKTSVFGKYAFTKGRTDVTVSGTAFLVSVSVYAKVFNATTKETKDNSALWGDGQLKHATVSVESGDVTIPGIITSTTKHSYTAAGASGPIPDMKIDSKSL